MDILSICWPVLTEGISIKVAGVEVGTLPGLQCEGKLIAKYAETVSVCEPHYSQAVRKGWQHSWGLADMRQKYINSCACST